MQAVSANSLSTTTLATGGLDGRGLNDFIHYGSEKAISGNGRVTVYATPASNLIRNDHNNNDDVFAYDRITKKTELISQDANGKPANGRSLGASISADGRFVAYITNATNIPLETTADRCSGPCFNIIVHDRTANKNVLANRNTLGSRIHILWHTPPTISANGNFVTFISDASVSPNDTNQSDDVLVRDLRTNVTRVASVGNDGRTGSNSSVYASISDDGRYVAFETVLPLVQGDTNGTLDIFVRDMRIGNTKLVSAASNGRAANSASFDPTISDDGRYVTFVSHANDVVSNDTNSYEDVFVRDVQAGTTRLVSVATNGARANNHSSGAGLSGDGRYVVFSSSADNLVPADTNESADVFIHYRDYGITRRVNVVSYAGPPAVGGSSYRPSISRDGKAVKFLSSATNLHPTPLVPFWATNLYIAYNPVVDVPYYDANDFFDFPGL